MATELDLRDELGLIGFTSEIQWLLRLDEVWTRWLGSPGLSGDAMATLADVGTTMERILALLSLKDRLDAVEHAAMVRKEAAAETIQAIFREEPQLQLGAVRNLGSPEGFQEFVAARAVELVRATPEAIDHLSSKATTLRKGEWVPGDLDRQMICLLMAIVACNGAMLSLRNRDNWYGIALGALKDLASFGCVL